MKTLAMPVTADARLRRLVGSLADRDVDVYLTTHTADICWLTGFTNVFDEEQAHLALIAREGSAERSTLETHSLQQPLLFTDARYSAALRTLDAEKRWRILDEHRPRFAYVVELLREWCGAHAQDGQLRIGIESDLRLDAYRALTAALDEQDLSAEVVELPSLVTGLRAVKDAGELESLKAAQALTDAAFDYMLGYLKIGLTEREAACELEFFMRRAGAQGVAFPSIVASGPNSAKPHAVPGERVFERGDFVLMDFGARLDDYRSDMTRTVVLGKASEQQRAMYAAVLAAQSAVIEALKPGMTGLEAQGIAERVIAEQGFAGAFIHSLGHGVGIDIHELPLLAPKVKTALEVGNVVTVEPGVYLEGIGGVRIEDYGVITEHGFEPFTHSPHELIELS
ncbi:MAG: Xaa-Pro peptidase family protein [Coriobacteriales bacterium]|jgi:Xaa-Pro aminopeptidase|nr:Xaa-Pro peptidase family protein [Coriobacteriales bacterium]